MIRQPIADAELRSHLRSLPQDGATVFLLEMGKIRGVFLHGTRMVNSMRASHELGILETLVLGQAYLAAGLMAQGLKNSERTALRIDCDGPIRGLSVEASAEGEVRGYLKQVPIPVDTPLDSFDLAPFFGNGMLQVSRFTPGNPTPQTGQVELSRGRLAHDLAWYYLMSEQLRTAIELSVKFDRQGRVTGAAGLYLQSMPGADDNLLERIEARMYDLVSPGQFIAEGGMPDEFVYREFCDMNPVVVGNQTVQFMCHCSHGGFGSFLSSLPAKELDDMIENGPWPVVAVCHNCNSRYSYTREELQALRNERA